MKLIDLLFENSTKIEYIDSIKKCMSVYSPTVSTEKDSGFLTVQLTDKFDKSKKEKFTRFVTNNRLGKIDPAPQEVKSIIDQHDLEFVKKHNLKTTG